MPIMKIHILYIFIIFSCCTGENDNYNCNDCAINQVCTIVKEGEQNQDFTPTEKQYKMLKRVFNKKVDPDMYFDKGIDQASGKQVFYFRHTKITEDEVSTDNNIVSFIAKNVIHYKYMRLDTFCIDKIYDLQYCTGRYLFLAANASSREYSNELLFVFYDIIKKRLSYHTPGYSPEIAKTHISSFCKNKNHVYLVSNFKFRNELNSNDNGYGDQNIKVYRFNEEKLVPKIYEIQEYIARNIVSNPNLDNTDTVFSCLRMVPPTTISNKFDAGLENATLRYDSTGSNKLIIEIPKINLAFYFDHDWELHVF